MNKYNLQKMFQQTFSTDSFERKPLIFQTSNSKSKIRIEKSKLLPPNFFRPLTILTSQNDSLIAKQTAPTPCFGSHTQENKQFELSKPIQKRQKSCDKQDFYSWIKKSSKPLSSRVQTVPTQISTSASKKRHVSERKTRLQRVKSVQQEGNKSAFKIFKKYQHLIGEKIDHIQAESYYKFKIKPVNFQNVEKTFKNHFKMNGSKRGYAETKYKQTKALNSINTEKQPSSILLPSISNG